VDFWPSRVRAFSYSRSGACQRLSAGTGPSAHAAGRPCGFNAFLLIGADGRVNCFAGKVELDKAPEPCWRRFLAEELDVAL